MTRPPFCPHRDCPLHLDPLSPDSRILAHRRWVKRDGYYTTAVRGPVRRFRCLLCGRGFSEQTFSIDYFVKRTIDYQRIESSLCTCRGVRASARSLGCSPDSITNRTSRLARQCISAHSRIISRLSPDEPFAADGFESFSVSQYFPNNIHLLLGSRSQLVFFCDYLTLRRSGRMTALQKRTRAALEHFSRPDPHALTRSFSELLDHLSSLVPRCASAPVVLNTDKKLEYRQALKAHRSLAPLIDSGAFSHSRTDSRAPRTHTNPLFAVNYIDRELRKDLAEHVRETVRFARNVNHCMERLWIYLVNHNLSKRFRINDPAALSRRHVTIAGAEEALIEQATERLYQHRRFLSFETLEPAQLRVWRREHETPLRTANRRLLRAVMKRVRKGPVDVSALMKEMGIECATVVRPQYLPRYALA